MTGKVSAAGLAGTEFVGMDDELRIGSAPSSRMSMPCQSPSHPRDRARCGQQQVWRHNEREHEPSSARRRSTGLHVAGAIAVGEMAEESDGEQSPPGRAGVELKAPPGCRRAVRSSAIQHVGDQNPATRPMSNAATGKRGRRPHCPATRPAIQPLARSRHRACGCARA